MDGLNGDVELRSGPGIKNNIECSSGYDVGQDGIISDPGKLNISSSSGVGSIDLNKPISLPSSFYNLKNHSSRGKGSRMGRPPSLKLKDIFWNGSGRSRQVGRSSSGSSRTQSHVSESKGGSNSNSEEGEALVTAEVGEIVGFKVYGRNAQISKLIVGEGVVNSNQ